MNLLRVGSLNGFAVIVRSAVSLTITKLCAVALGPSGFVGLGNVQTVTSLWMGLSNGTLYNSVTRLLAEPGGADAKRQVITTGVTAAVVIGVLLAPLTWLVARQAIGDSLGGTDRTVLADLIAASCPLVAVGSVLTGYFNGSQRLNALVAGNVLASGLTLLAAIFLIHEMGSLGALLTAVAASVTPCVAYVCIFISNRSARTELHEAQATKLVDWEILGKMAPYIWTALASAVAAPTTVYVVRWLLVEHVGSVQAGNWQGVWRLSTLYTGPLTATFSVYLIPRFASIVSIPLLRAELRRCVLLVVVGMGLIAVSVLPWRKELVHLVLSQSFAGAAPLIPLQLLGDSLKLVGWIMGFLLLSKGAIRQYVVGEVLFTIAFIAITAALVNSLGVGAAVAAYVLSYLLYVIFCLYASRRAGLV